MNNITKIKILKPVNEVFEAIINHEKMSNYWFSSGSGRLVQGEMITWRYDEYNAEMVIKVLEVDENKKIVYSWGGYGEETIVTITLKPLDNMSTIIEVNEAGFEENDDDLISKLVDNKEGWVYMLTCLKGYLEFGVKNLRAGLVK